MRVQGIVVWAAAAGMVPCVAAAQGTKLWKVDRYDQMERGQTEGVAIRSDGKLLPGPATSLIFQTTGNYVWAVAADAAGNAYVGMGGTTAGGAVVMKVSGDGKSSTKVFEGKELGVQGLRTGPDGRVYAATSPDGKVYRLGATPAEATVVFDPATMPEKPKYLWDLAFAPGGASGSGAKEMFVAAGAPAVVYRVPLAGGKAEVAFRTVDQHVRCLLMGPDGTLWAGTDGSGVIYRFDMKAAGAKPFAAYAAPKREITSLTMDPAGNLFAAGVGTRPAAGASMPGLPPLPVTGTVGVTVTFSQPGSANAAQANTLIPEGSEIYRIAADGSPAKLVAFKDDVVYTLAFDDGTLLAATGNRGRVYRVDAGVGGEDAGRYADVAHLEAAQGMAFAAVPGGQIVGTSNSGKVYRLEDRPAASSTYTSEVFDAGGYAQWGRAEVEASGAGSEILERTGNVENPAMGWSDWTPVAKDGSARLPGGRFAQWKAVLRAGGSVDSVGLNYLGKNIAPVVDEVVVQPGARVTPPAPSAASQTVQVSFPPANGAAAVPVFVPDPNTQPLTAQKDKTGITARWSAHDDNGDDLMFAVWYRGTGEKNWRLLKDKISDRYLSFDSELLPDGRYEMKVVASDAPVHSNAEALTGERVSGEFVVDTTPPVPGVLTATLLGAGSAMGKPQATGTGSGAQTIHAVFSVKDATSPISHAEYSLDAGPWEYLEPVGKVSDSREERYDFTVPLGDAGKANAPAADVREHVLAVRVYDRFENVVSVKAVVR